MKISLSVLYSFLFSILLFKQGYCQTSYRLTYNYQFQSSISKPSVLRKGKTVLFIQDGKSYFADEMFLVRSEIKNKNISLEQKLNELRGLSQPSFRFEIYKTPSAVILTQSFDNNYVGYEEPSISPESWSIKSDTVTILGLACQKAEINFGGREWVAWFSDKVPISDGPYKFCGLPGLIVKIESADTQYKFELDQLRKSEIALPKLDYTKITKKRYEELRDIDPINSALKRQKIGKTTVIKNGVSMSNADVINELKAELADRNLIEID